MYIFGVKIQVSDLGLRLGVKLKVRVLVKISKSSISLLNFIATLTVSLNDPISSDSDQIFSERQK